jgi:hypothetical protein
MTRYRLVALLVIGVFGLSGCAGLSLGTMNSQLTNLVGQLAGLKSDSPEALARRAELVQLVDKAGKAAADSAAREPLMAVGFYRIACVAAWKAGSPSVVALSRAGAATCARLPAHDDSAPRDCALIKLSEPLSVYEDLLRQTNQFNAKLQELRLHMASALLPSSDAEPLARTFFGLAAQYRKVSDIRAAMSDAVPAALKAETNQDRLTIYCAARKTSNLAANVQEATLATLQTQTDRVNEMERNYQATVGHFPDCRSS